jgi:hypothetical protein
MEPDGGVVLDITKNTYFSLNDTGAAIWARLEEGRTLAEIEVDLAEAYGVEREEVRPDIVAFVNELVQRALVDAKD